MEVVEHELHSNPPYTEMLVLWVFSSSWLFYYIHLVVLTILILCLLLLQLCWLPEIAQIQWIKKQTFWLNKKIETFSFVIEYFSFFGGETRIWKPNTFFLVDFWLKPPKISENILQKWFFNFFLSEWIPISISYNKRLKLMFRTQLLIFPSGSTPLAPQSPPGLLCDQLGKAVPRSSCSPTFYLCC